MSAPGTTPGPWSAVECEGEVAGSLAWEISSDCACPIAVVEMPMAAFASYSGNLPQHNAEGKANARLIAAAPDLYEALELLVGEELGGDARAPRNDTECYRPVVTWADRAIARTALAKARGEQS